MRKCPSVKALTEKFLKYDEKKLDSIWKTAYQKSEKLINKRGNKAAAQAASCLLNARKAAVKALDINRKKKYKHD